MLRSFDGVAYLELDAQGCVRAANPSFARQVGIAPDDLVGRTDEALLFLLEARAAAAPADGVEAAAARVGRWLAALRGRRLPKRAVAYLDLDASGCVRAANPSFARQVGRDAADLVGRDAADLFPAHNAGMIRAWAAGAVLPIRPQLVNFVTGTHQPFTLRCLVARHDRGLALVGEADAEGARATAEQLMQLNNEFATVTRELTRRSRELEEAKAELAQALEELQTSYWHLQKIQEVLPVCMRCGRIRGDGATWQPVVEYLRTNDIFLSHGYCPACADATMREYGLEDE